MQDGCRRPKCVAIQNCIVTEGRGAGQVLGPRLGEQGTRGACVERAGGNGAQQALGDGRVGVPQARGARGPRGKSDRRAGGKAQGEREARAGGAQARGAGEALAGGAQAQGVRRARGRRGAGAGRARGKRQACGLGARAVLELCTRCTGLFLAQLDSVFS